MSIPGSANLLMVGGAADAGYQIEQSLKFRGGQKLERTNSNDGSSRSFTLSYWVKKLYQGGNNMNVFGSNDGGSNWSYISYGESSGDDDQLIARSNGSQSGYSNGYVFDVQRKHRDPSAWQHHLLVVDKSAGTSKGYINGVLDEGEGGYGGTRSSNGWTFNKNMTQRIGVSGETGTSGYFEGYFAEFCFVDNSALSPTDFGEFDSTGSWVPIEPNVSNWGTNGWYLKFDPDATNGVGHDHSGNGNNWTASGFDTTSSSVTYDYSADSPTINLATFNPVYCSQNNAANRIDQAGLRFVSTGLGVVWSTMTPTCAPISSGKWYWEWSVNTADAYIGIIGENVNTVSSSNTQSQSGTILYYSGDGNKRIDNSASSYGSSYSGGGSDFDPAVGVALDKDNNTITFYRNGSSQGTINLSSSSVDLVNNPVIPVFLLADGTSFGNFGQRPFKYTPPADHVALSASALADSEIASPGEHVNTAHYQGDGTSSHAITGIGFQPSFSWVKALSASNSHVVQDALRGLGGLNGLQLTPNTSFVEDDNGNGHIGSYDSDGFTLEDSDESGPYPRAGTNTHGENYVAWLWKAERAFTQLNEG